MNLWAIEERFDITKYEGPLDLLSSLLSEQKVDVFQIPITEIANQYLAIINQATELDLELATEFLVMAATLLQIKTGLMLKSDDALLLDGSNEDGLDDFVLRILRYRRCKLLAEMLRENHATYGLVESRGPLRPQMIGVNDRIIADDFTLSKYQNAIVQLEKRNDERFQAVAAKMAMLVSRERISVKDKMKQVWDAVKKGSKVFFHELFPMANSSKRERITGFMAMLELIRRRSIKVTQSGSFKAMRLEVGDEALETLEEQSEGKI